MLAFWPVVFLLVIPAGSSLAQSSEDILKRLDALEKSNAQLKSRDVNPSQSGEQT